MTAESVTVGEDTAAAAEEAAQSPARRHGPRLSGAQKAAIVLAQLGPERSARILAALSDSEAIELTMEIANLPPVDSETVSGVVGEFVDRAHAVRTVGQGGVDAARAILEQRLGAKRAEEVLGQIYNKLAVGPLAFLVNVDPRQVVGFLVNEHPQTVAVLIAHMPPEDGARVLAGLPDPLGGEVAHRVATMERVSPDAVSQAATLLEAKLRSLSRGAAAATGGLPSLVEMLNRSDRSTERRVLEDLERRDAALAEAVRAKMFTFEDLLGLDDRSLQAVLRTLDTPDLALALKGAAPDVVSRFLSNMTGRSGADLTEEIETLGPVPASEVDRAQSTVVAAARRLADEGAIRLGREDGEIIE